MVVLDYRSGDKQSYAYRLQGFDTGWHYNRSERRATYTNLPPGDYVFEVKSKNQELYSNGQVKRMHITILPPWWKTWWAYLLYVVVTIIILEIVRRNCGQLTTTPPDCRREEAGRAEVEVSSLTFRMNYAHHSPLY